MTTQIRQGLSHVPASLATQKAKRVLLLTGPSRRHVEQLPLDGFTVEHFDGAEVHVPREVVTRAENALERCKADAIISLGGGAATGLGKALRLERPDLFFTAIPTTYSGSELTNIYGIREHDSKNTGRDDRVRPDLVVHEPALFSDMPKRLTVTSLLNALAHPISALSTGELEDATRRDALLAIELLVRGLDELLAAPRSPEGRRIALRGASLAARVLDRAPLGLHHRRTHEVGARFALEHSGLHAVLLPHSMRAIANEQPALYDEIAKAAGYLDLPGRIYDTLTLAGAPRSIVELGVDEGAIDAPELQDAMLGRRSSVDVERSESGAARFGPPIADARRVIVAVHGRGANADRMLADVRGLVGHDETIAIIAPQATDNRWYPKSYRATLSEHGADLDDALKRVQAELERVLASVSPERVFLAGFSQGACLAIEVVARNSVSIGGLVALAGARIGPAEEQPPITTDLHGTKVLLGLSRKDEWLDLADVERTGESLVTAGANATVIVDPGDAHEMSARQRVAARELLSGYAVRDGRRGFGNAHESEALPGALPLHQNSPRHPPYGLIPEQINGSGFAVARAENLRSWLYRVRPSAQHTPFKALAHPTLSADWNDAPIDPNLSGHRPLTIPEAPTDFVDGLATYGGAGDPSLRRGYAIHLYVANRSMEHRAFYNADGDFLIIPQDGGLTLQTELGILDVAPGQIALIPRGFKVSVQLAGPSARGYAGEVYGRSFTLPERGPVGANGLADARHFRAPNAFFEDRIDPGYRITAKLGNALHDAFQDHSPYDVVAWHGNYTPYVYDLADFSPVGNTRIDHPDPSIYTVLTSPLDEAGASSLDFVFFPPRWDPTEHTFRPPFFHRNATTEFNGIISDPGLGPDGPFYAGGYFLTPSMTAHGALASSVRRSAEKTDEQADRPKRIGDRSLWFQLESAMPIRLTKWARESDNRIADWPDLWGAYRSRFTPGER